MMILVISPPFEFLLLHSFSVKLTIHIMLYVNTLIL